MKLLMPIVLGLLLFCAKASIAQICNPYIAADAPTSRYILNSNGTALDRKTGLTWMRCAKGQTWDGVTCSGSPQMYSWKYALETAENTVFAEQNDWRLPNRKELQSLIENSCSEPAINLTAFPNTGIENLYTYWSSSPDSINDTQAWGVNFSEGDEFLADDKSREYYIVRLVRGG